MIDSSNDYFHGCIISSPAGIVCLGRCGGVATLLSGCLPNPPPDGRTHGHDAGRGTGEKFGGQPAHTTMGASRVHGIVTVGLGTAAGFGVRLDWGRQVLSPNPVEGIGNCIFGV